MFLYIVRLISAKCTASATNYSGRGINPNLISRPCAIYDCPAPQNLLLEVVPQIQRRARVPQCQRRARVPQQQGRALVPQNQSRALEYPHTMNPIIKFCSHCGAPVSQRIPPGDTLIRAVCDACDTIHYQNPKLVIGSLPVWEDKVLLCRRAIEPRLGMWTLPAGFMENYETMPEAAARETREEACANIELGEMYTLISVPHICQVHVFYRARLLDLDFSPGIETQEVALLAEDQIPWKELAFRTTVLTLRHYYADRKTGHFGLHTTELRPPGNPHGAQSLPEPAK